MNLTEQGVFSAFKKTHDDLVGSVLNNLPQEAPLLYHYTSVDAAHCIIKNREIRLTNIRYLNDPSELCGALSIFEKSVIELLGRWKKEGHTRAGRSKTMMLIAWVIISCFESARKKLATKERLVEVFSEFMEFDELITELTRLAGEDDWEIYLASFSERENELRQWIPYAQNATGVAIGFDACFNSRENTHALGHTDLVPCSYKPESIKVDFTNKVLESFFERYEKEVIPLKNDALNSFVIHEFIQLLITDLVACKTSEYKDEKEWRLFMFENVSDHVRLGKHPEYCVSNNVLKPYYSCKLVPSSFKRILLGPLADELNIESFSRLTKQYKIDCIIEKSSLPYRG